MAEAVKVIGLDEVRKHLAELPEKWFDEVKEVVKDSTFRVHKKISARVSTGAGGSLHSRSGQLRRSLQTRVRGSTFDNLSGQIFSEGGVAPYNVVHEFGATIKAKNAYARTPGGPYLNIPLDANKTPAGVMRQSARDVFSRGGYMVQGRSGKWLVMSGDGAPMFVLVKSVTIPPRLKMIETGEDEIPTLLSNLARATEDAIQ